METPSDRRATPPDDLAPTPQPVLSPDELQQRERSAAGVLPAADQSSVERSAGEGMVATPVEAATVPTGRVTGAATYELAGGRSLPVTVELMIVGNVWSGTLWPTGDEAPAVDQEGRLLLSDGRAARLRVTGVAEERCLVEGIAEGEAAG